MTRILLAMALPFAAHASDLSHSMRLSNAEGVPLSGTFDVQVDLVRDAAPGPPEVSCHSEALSGVAFEGGYATVILSDVSPDCGQGDLWVATSIGSPLVELAPRQPLTASRSSLSANHVSGYVDLLVDDDFSDGPVCTVEGRMAWESGTQSIQVCDGSEWLSISLSNLGSQTRPAGSCLALREDSGSAASGVYWLDPDGSGTAITPFQATCDMVTDGGGWTLVYKITDLTDMRTTGATNTGALLGDDIASAGSGKLSDSVIRELYTEQYRTEQHGTDPYRTYCTFDNVNNYTDSARNSKRCGTGYSPSASYSTVVSAAQWSNGFSDYTGGNGLIFQLRQEDSRTGCHIRNAANSVSGEGCSSTGGCHCRAWVR